MKQNWWGENRIDYVLYAPETISNLPKKSLPYIFHSCFWESQDAVAFILRIINSNKEMTVLNEGLKYSPSAAKNDKEPTEKWQKRLNRVKLRVIFFFKNKCMQLFSHSFIFQIVFFSFC